MTAVRAAEHSDLDALARLAALTFPLACPPGSTPADQQEFIDTVLSVDRFAEYLADPLRDVLVAGDGEPVGYTMLVAGEPADEDVRAALRLRPTIELSKCYVHPAHHGAGVAHALMDASLDVARARGARGMWLGVNQQNTRAQAFYLRSGFAVVGTKHFTVGTRVEDDYVLERPL
ncbi:GNAT family N-acetyltransferase [Cellulomonas fengjieae]|uniref:GNAT family N-acetyltransferase n=1 Tax=Cellulomonas fengjieae TaxID=2819978 RepID=A0ABS3SES9_9CELL|nr:GNAT family N-acetyltransferase [Cellulomonas fengjieae]MBO3083465.1 GNAT family N-acetyltransferase [Cellulomonas fengjieae]MBO3101784.1 GNAT family N-acetyltransferase [Cellulomonas fengjieae]QVI65207.1 GNAT family N-acetyltransferase [Cellulomonas fengjieae]